jgi:hypothetical protein
MVCLMSTLKRNLDLGPFISKKPKTHKLTTKNNKNLIGHFQLSSIFNFHLLLNYIHMARDFFMW